MFRLYFPLIGMPFVANPNNTIERMLQQAGGAWSGRSLLNALSPGFPVESPPQDFPSAPIAPFPTDVPTSEPMDVPVPEPRDVPVADPGKVPEPAKPRPDEVNPKPRSVP